MSECRKENLAHFAVTIIGKDRPGIVGWIGTIMGKHGVNIASMSLGRDKEGGQALTVLNLDSAASDALLSKIKADKDLFNMKVAGL